MVGESTAVMLRPEEQQVVILDAAGKAANFKKAERDSDGVNTGAQWVAMEGSPTTGGVAKAPPTDFNLQVQQYRSWIYCCVSLIASSWAALPLHLMIDRGTGDDEEIFDHIFLEMWKNINDWMDAFEFRELIMIYLLLTGNAYIYLVRNILGAPVQMWIIPSQFMKIIPSGSSFIAGYVYQRGGKTIPFASDEIIHLKIPSPHSVIYGMGPLFAAAYAIDHQNKMYNYESALFANQGRPDIGLIPDLKDGQTLTDKQFERLQRQWNQKYRGVNKAGQAIVLDGISDVKILNFKPREIAFLKGRDKVREEIYSVYKVPISFGSDKSPSRAHWETDVYRYALHCLQPHNRRIQDKFNSGLTPMYQDNLYIRFDSPVPSDKKFRLEEREANLKSGYSLVDDERAIDNLGPRPDGYGNIRLVPSGMLPIEAVLGGKALIMDGVKNGRVQIINTEDYIGALCDKLTGKAAARPVEQVEVLEPPSAAPRVSMATSAAPPRSLPPLKDGIEGKAYGKSSEEVRAIVAPQIGSMRRGVKGVYDEMSGMIADLLNPYGKNDPLTQYIANTLLSDLEGVDWSTKFYDAADKDVDKAFEKIGGLAADELEEIPIEQKALIIDEGAIHLVNALKFGFSKVVKKNAVDKVSLALTWVIENGGTVTEARDVMIGLDVTWKARANTIARTEIMRASNGGTFTAWQQSGVIVSKSWLCAGSPCPICDPHCGERVPLNDNFFDQDEELRYTGTDGKPKIYKNEYGAVLYAPLHPHCRCTIQGHIV